MSLAVEHPPRRVATWLTRGFRPFFFAAGSWSAVALALWVIVLTTETALPSRFDLLARHVHEMLFGFVTAAVAGFLLTAIPNWTRRPRSRVRSWPDLRACGCSAEPRA